jgi:hypothetical protein
MPLSLLGNNSVKNPSMVARQRLGRNVTVVTNTHATIEELLDASFPMWPVSYQKSRRIFLSRTSCLNVVKELQYLHNIRHHDDDELCRVRLTRAFLSPPGADGLSPCFSRIQDLFAPLVSIVMPVLVFCFCSYSV